MNEQSPVTDRIYANPLESVPGFSFDEQVTRVFPDMINRSVPGYTTVVAHTGEIARRYAQPNTHLYDLGCSLGASTLSMHQRLQSHPDRQSLSLIAADNSSAMISRCQQLSLEDSPRVQWRCKDVRELALQPASVVVLNYTLQFLPPEQRDELIKRIAQALVPGGVLVLSEKILLDDPIQQAFATDSHHAFKRANGYSDLEISQKRSALERVLICESVAQHQARLKHAGFQSSAVWFQCFNFCSMLCVKPA